MRRVLLSVGVVALLATGSVAFARQNDTLRGDSRRQQMLDSEMARLRVEPPDGSARKGLCPLVRGASAEVNNYISARLRQVAYEVGARYAHDACEPNVVILFTSEPGKLLTEAGRAKRLNYNGVSKQRIEAFQTSAQPVRWLHGSARPGLKTLDARPDNALVIIDANKAADVKVSALADYVSLVSLAAVSPSAANGSSIMNLFDGPDAPQAMTEGDRAYLRSVYRRGAN